MFFFRQHTARNCYSVSIDDIDITPTRENRSKSCSNDRKWAYAFVLWKLSFTIWIFILKIIRNKTASLFNAATFYEIQFWLQHFDRGWRLLPNERYKVWKQILSNFVFLFSTKAVFMLKNHENFFAVAVNRKQVKPPSYFWKLLRSFLL